MLPGLFLITGQAKIMQIGRLLKHFFPMAMLLITVGVIPCTHAAQETPPHHVIGQQIQGGLLMGDALPGSRVYFDDQSLTVAPDGRFILGLGHQAQPESLLIIEQPDGTRHQMSLTIAQRDYDIQRIDGLPERKVSPNLADLRRIKSDRQAILQARRGSENTLLTITPSPDGPRLDWPVLGRISGVYGSQRILNGQPRSPHLGIDIAAPKGTPIGAPASGRVILVDDDMFFTGKTVMLDHGHGLTSVYAHMDQIAVQEGQKVATGTRLGTVGSTGRSTGPHLHWGLHWYGIGLDPALLTGPMPALEPSPTTP